MKWLLISLVFSTGTARAELAIDIQSPTISSGVYLFYQEDDLVFRAKCEPGITFDIAHCFTSEARLATGFYAGLSRNFAVALRQADTEAREAWVALKRVDERLFQLVNTTIPSEGDAVSGEDIAAKEWELQKIELNLAEIRDQIARLEAAMGHGDATVVEQLGVQRDLLVTAQKKEGIAQSELLSLRKAFVDQRALTGDHAFESLVRMQKTYKETFDKAQVAVRKGLEDIVCGEVAARRIAEKNFAWTEVCTYSDPPRVNDAFEDPLMMVPIPRLRPGTYKGPGDNGQVIRVSNVAIDSSTSFMKSLTVDGTLNFTCKRGQCVSESTSTYVRPLDETSFYFGPRDNLSVFVRTGN